MTNLTGLMTVNLLGAIKSKCFLNIFSKKWRGMIFSFPLRVTPMLSQNSFIADGVYPLLLKPLIVKILGSSQPKT
jgi:hypothetical protein